MRNYGISQFEIYDVAMIAKNNNPTKGINNAENMAEESFNRVIAGTLALFLIVIFLLKIS